MGWVLIESQTICNKTQSRRTFTPSRCVFAYLGRWVAASTRWTGPGPETSRAWTCRSSRSSRRPSCCRLKRRGSGCNSPGSHAWSSPRCSPSHSRTRRSASRQDTPALNPRQAADKSDFAVFISCDYYFLSFIFVASHNVCSRLCALSQPSDVQLNSSAWGGGEAGWGLNQSIPHAFHPL